MKQPIHIEKLIRNRRVPVSADLAAGEKLTVVVDCRNAAGHLIYPYVYEIDTIDVRECPVITRQGGAGAWAVPLGRFRKIAKRAELPLEDAGDCIAAGDPKVKDWRGYL